MLNKLQSQCTAWRLTSQRVVLVTQISAMAIHWLSSQSTLTWSPGHACHAILNALSKYFKSANVTKYLSLWSKVYNVYTLHQALLSIVRVPLKSSEGFSEGRPFLLFLFLFLFFGGGGAGGRRWRDKLLTYVLDYISPSSRVNPFFFSSP